MKNKEYIEALKWLLANETIYRGRTRLPISPSLRFSIQALKREEVLSIIKEKEVDIGLLKRSTSWLDYYTRFKHRTGKNTELIEEEFELLKRWVDA